MLPVMKYARSGDVSIAYEVIGDAPIDLVCEVKAKGIKKLMLPLVASILKKEDGDHLQRVKKALED
jgi:hypothetical protein